MCVCVICSRRGPREVDFDRGREREGEKERERERRSEGEVEEEGRSEGGVVEGGGFDEIEDFRVISEGLSGVYLTA